MITNNYCYVSDKCKKYKNGECDLSKDEFCIKLYKLDYLYNEANMSNAQKRYIPLYPDADGTDRDEFIRLKNIQNDIENFVNDGCNLYIYSQNVGNGKTSWALRMIQSYFNKIWYKCDLNCKAMFINVPRFLLALKENISQKSDYIEHIKSNILDVDLVVWDEIANKSNTEYEIEQLLNFINTRIDFNKANIFTSNVVPNELDSLIGARLQSRIINLSTVIELKGADKRGISK